MWLRQVAKNKSHMLIMYFQFYGYFLNLIGVIKKNVPVIIDAISESMCSFVTPQIAYTRTSIHTDVVWDIIGARMRIGRLFMMEKSPEEVKPHTGGSN